MCLLLSTATMCISEINYDYGIILILRFKSQWNFLGIDVDCSRRWPGHRRVLAGSRIHRRRTSQTWLKGNRFVWCSLIVKFMFGCSSDWITWCFHSKLGDEIWYGCCAAVTDWPVLIACRRWSDHRWTDHRRNHHPPIYCYWYSIHKIVKWWKRTTSWLDDLFIVMN